MFQLTITYNSGDIHITKAYPAGGKRPSTRKAAAKWTYLAVLAWCALNGKPVSQGQNCQTWQFNTLSL